MMLDLKVKIIEKREDNVNKNDRELQPKGTTYRWNSRKGYKLYRKMSCDASKISFFLAVYIALHVYLIALKNSVNVLSVTGNVMATILQRSL